MVHFYTEEPSQVLQNYLVSLIVFVLFLKIKTSQYESIKRMTEQLVVLKQIAWVVLKQVELPWWDKFYLKDPPFAFLCFIF